MGSGTESLSLSRSDPRLEPVLPRDDEQLLAEHIQVDKDLRSFHLRSDEQLSGGFL